MREYQDICKIFGSRLKLVRHIKGMSQDNISKLIGIGRSLYTKYETGAVLPPCQKLCQIVEALGVSADYLLGFKDDKNIGK